MPQTCSGAAVPGCLLRPGRGRVALLVGLVLSLSCVTRAPAATTWTVCASGCDYTSIKAAIAAPTTVDGDTLTIAAGTYTEAGITVNKSLTLQGEEAATTIVQAAATPGTASDRVFTIPSGVTVTLQDLTIRYGLVRGEGYPRSYGGGLYNSYSSTLTLTHSTVSGNFATNDGGGLYNEGTLTLTHSTVRGNTAKYYGGGLYIYSDGPLTLSHSTVRGNYATHGGGGLANDGPLTLTHSTVRNNTTTSLGGGLYNFAGTLTLTHSTVSGNTATAGGGFFNDIGTMVLTASTVSNNAGGGFYKLDGWLTLTSSIVANHPDGGDCRNVSGAIFSHGYNLDSDGSCWLTTATDRPGVGPLLGPLQNNGGRTFTHALRPGSPAIDAIPFGANGCGTTLVSDQRWQARPQPAGGRCDIGAYEVEVTGQPLSGWVTGFTPQTVVCTNVTTGQQVTLSAPASPWDCEAAGLGVTSGDRVAMRVQGPVAKGAIDVGGAVVGMAPRSGGCTNLTTGQEAPFQQMVGATAASCVAAGLVVHPRDHVQMSVQGVAE